MAHVVSAIFLYAPYPLAWLLGALATLSRLSGAPTAAYTVAWVVTTYVVVPTVALPAFNGAAGVGKLVLSAAFFATLLAPLVVPAAVRR